MDTKLVLICLLALGRLSGAPDAITSELRDETPKERRAVVAELASRLEATYVLPEVAIAMGRHLRAQSDTGDYDQFQKGEAFAERITADLRAISHDGHIRMRYHEDPEQVLPAWNTPARDAEARYRRHGERSNFGFVQVEIMSGNIGYLRLDQFGDPAQGGETAAAAMRFIAHTDALIIDLRHNGGGGAMGVMLATYLFGAEPVHLSNFYLREGDETVQTWTAPFVPGPTYENKSVYILIGPATASAAESFAYDLQALKRVQLVGRKTAGAANPGQFFRLSEHLAVFIPTGRPINPVTKTNWEGTGVRPDIDVAVEEALSRAHDLALEALLRGAESDPELTALRQKALDARRAGDPR